MGIILSKRLQRIADMAPRCRCATDVGTDHGLVPLWLLQHGVCERAIASDINEGPLSRARENAEASALAERLELRLCDGLAGISENEVEAVIIAGMGGETIQGILSAAPWTKDKALVLQPQSKIPELRAWLHAGGYAVTDASLVRDAGRLYVVWSVRGGWEEELSAAEFHVERRLFEKRDELLPEYIRHILAKNSSVLDGIKSSAKADAGLFEKLSGLSSSLEKLLKECEKWQK